MEKNYDFRFQKDLMSISVLQKKLSKGKCSYIYPLTIIYEIYEMLTIFSSGPPLTTIVKYIIEYILVLLNSNEDVLKTVGKQTVLGHL